MSFKKVAIIGAGASGLFLAHLLSENECFKVSLFEKKSQIASKVRASGGGRANIFNRVIRPTDYNNAAFIEKLLAKVSPASIEKKFHQFGLLTISDSEGRVYPVTQFSQTIVDVLSNFSNNNVNVFTETAVSSIKTDGNNWIINNTYIFDFVVLATGSPANLLQKFQKGYSSHLDSLRLNIKPFKSSLTGFQLRNYPKSLSGCRTKAIASLFQGDKLIHKESGEVVFKDDGISGIVVMNLSSYYRRLESTNNCSLRLNLTYWDENFDVKEYLVNNNSLVGIIHPKLSALFEKQHFDIQNFKFEILDTYPISSAQVCCGGVDVTEIDDFFAAKKYRNLYILGEMLDIDGLCGGYNLFFAFASAMVAGQKLLDTI